MILNDSSEHIEGSRREPNRKSRVSWVRGALKDVEEYAPLAKSHTFFPEHPPYFNMWDNNYFLELRRMFLCTKLHFISWRSNIADKQNIGISFPSQKQFAGVAKEQDNQANLKGFCLKES